MSRRVLVVGGGAAGMMAAIFAAGSGAQVTVVERNEKPGRKLMITGKGRCNVTNACDPGEFFSHVTSNPRFLYSSLAAFSAADAIAFFEASGVPLKTERGRRVFPQSDRASDIVDALVRRMRKAGVRLACDRIRGLEIRDGAVTAAIGERESYPCDACVVATGGLSYPLTGSTGDGYELARSAGHRVVPPRPSLVPLVAEGDFCRECMGLSLRNAGLTLYRGERAIYTDFGELLFTHFGLSGPVILSASARMEGPGPYRAEIDLKPALSRDQLDARLLREIAENPKREFRTMLRALLPAKMVEPFRALTGVPGEERVSEITREQRDRVRTLLKALPIRIVGTRPVEEAIVTAGGVDCREIDPKTMASRKLRGLYFAGEVMDVSAETGGFSLQIAFSTGRAAGVAAAAGAGGPKETPETNPKN